MRLSVPAELLVTAAIALFTIVATAGCEGPCVSCIPPAPALGEASLEPAKVLAAPPGGLWWLEGRSTTWSLEATSTTAEQLLAVVAETSQATALRVPDLPPGSTWRLLKDGQFAASTEVLPASDTRVIPPVTEERLALEFIERGTISTCASACLDGPFDRPGTIDTPALRWRTALTRDDLSSVVIDVWRLDTETPDDEVAPRIVDTALLDSGVRGSWYDAATSEIAITIRPEDAGAEVALRLRSLGDASIGNVSRTN